MIFPVDPGSKTSCTEGLRILASDTLSRLFKLKVGAVA